jgi:hypothetical protein
VTRSPDSFAPVTLTRVITRAAQLGLAVLLWWGSWDIASAQTPGDSAQSAAQAAAPPTAQATPPGESMGSGHVTWTFSERARYSGLSNQFRPGLSGDDQSVVFRTSLKADVVWSKVTFGAELQDVRAYLTDSQSNVSTRLVNAIDVLQAYAFFGSAGATTSRAPELQIGRFTMELGSGRLVAQEPYRDVTRTFTGGKFRWRPRRERDRYGVRGAAGVDPAGEPRRSPRQPG